MQELLEIEQVRSLLEIAEERGFVEPLELEALVTELEMSEDELALSPASSRRWASRCRRLAAESEEVEEVAPPVAPVFGAGDSLQLFLADVGRHKLLNAGRGGHAREADREGRSAGQAADDRVEPPPRRLDREGLPRVSACRSSI